MSLEPRGWCPTALKPMETGDGLLVRVHPPGAELSAAQMRALAQGAAACGNGLLELSTRGNVQLRGVQPHSHAPLVESLSAAGLIDAVDRTGRPHVAMVSPLSGLDATERYDARAVAGEIEAVLAADDDLAALPPKFCAVVDGGGLALDAIEADIRLVALGSGPRLRLALALASPDGLAWIGSSRPADAAAVVHALATAFVRERRNETRARRLRDLPAGAGDRLAEAARPWLAPLAEAPPARPAPAPVGGIALGPGRWAASLGLTFGRSNTGTFERLAGWSERYGDGTVRIAPWRSIILPNVAAADVPALLGRAQEAGLIVDPGDPRAALAVCPGAPACASAGADTQADAARLAAELGPLLEGASVHISGCAKGCARRGAADLTLIGDGGRYGIVLGGTARSAPVRVLAIDEIIARLRASPATVLPAERLRHAFEAAGSL